MFGYRYKVSLRIWHPDIDPDHISDCLKLQPNIVDRVGQVRYLPNGRSIPNSGTETYWVHAFDLNSSDQEFEDFLSNKLSELSLHQDLFAEITSSGGRCELFIGFFIKERCGFNFSPQLLHQASLLQLSLALDIYTEGNSEAD